MQHRTITLLATLIVGGAFFSSQGQASVIKTTVVVLKNVPTTSYYDWQVAGQSSVSCYGSSCRAYYSPASGGRARVNGAVLKLLLPDGRIVIANCVMKANVAINIISLLGPPSSPVYRSCRVPDANSTIRAEFNRSDVKVFMQAPSIDGSGRTGSETYTIRGVLNPAGASALASQVSLAPEAKDEPNANSTSVTFSPAHASGMLIATTPEGAESEPAVQAPTTIPAAAFAPLSPISAGVIFQAGDGKFYRTVPGHAYVEEVKVVTPAK